MAGRYVGPLPRRNWIKGGMLREAISSSSRECSGVGKGTKENASSLVDGRIFQVSDHCTKKRLWLSQIELDCFK